MCYVLIGLEVKWVIYDAGINDACVIDILITRKLFLIHFTCKKDNKKKTIKDEKKKKRKLNCVVFYKSAFGLFQRGQVVQLNNLEE